ncbi:UUP1 family membrane protein [Halioglobus pacificus]|uniref:Gonadoliberin III n=1 Tax=Parahalioglobus pacificus TaxID=930806 RepID=A0A918XDI3_9GAMM|nr:UUP1 family membrane protein [Halioglobus pacificus]GHD26206.1 gonadoliberin III [Halioglobus pacificus]
MNSRTSFFTVVGALALAGVLIAALRHMETGAPLLPGAETEVWLVEARVDFRAQGGPVNVSLSLPEADAGYSAFNEQSASAGYGYAVVEQGDDRRAEWTRRQASGAQTLYFSAQFVAQPPEAVTPGQPSAPPRAVSVFWNDAQSTAAQNLLDRARQTSAGPRSLVRELVKSLNVQPLDQNAALLLGQAEDRAGLLVRLLNEEGIPAREVMGLYLRDARRRQPLASLVDVYLDDRWVLHNPVTGVPGMPADFLLWHRAGASLLDVAGGRNSRVSFSMLRQSVPVQQLAYTTNSDSAFARIGLHSLPIEEQSMFRMLLLLPLGAAVVVFMRVLVGVRTAGTFMPILISLAFLQTSLLPGLVSFVSVVAIGLMMRAYLSRLNLLLVARIATLIVLVIFVITALSVIGYQLGYSTGMVITFFPMIIIAWTIERMSILWEEEGAREVLIQGSGSLFVAIVAYLLMHHPLLEHLSFNFPELNLILLAAILAMGQYTGYKLTELYRFRALLDD